MSSILDALEKLESRRTQTGGPEPPHRGRRNITPLLASAALIAFAAGIALAAVWLRPKASAPAPAVVATVEPPPTTPPVVVPPATQPPPPPARAPTAPARAMEQPWAEVVTPTPARDVAPPPAPAAVAARTPAHERSADAAEPAGMVAAVAPPAATAPPPPAAAPAAHAAHAAPRPAGAPGVRVSFLVYSSAPDRRTVALAIDQAGLVTLHEGESSNGLSVSQILPDGVELTWQGQSFKVPARD